MSVDIDGAQEDIVFLILNTQVQFPSPCITFPHHSKYLCLHPTGIPVIPVQMLITAVNILKILGSWRLWLRNLHQEMTLGGNFDTLTDEASLVSELFSEKSPYYNITFHAGNWFWKEGQCLSNYYLTSLVRLTTCLGRACDKQWPSAAQPTHHSLHQGL